MLRQLAVAAACLATAVLMGCAGPRLVQSDVRSFSTLSVLPEPATYRFERLPSQQQSAAFAPIETQAEQALARVGLTHDEVNARLAVQISTEGGISYPRNWSYAGYPWGPDWGWGLGWGGRWHGGFGFGMGWTRDMAPPLYRRKVSVVVRDIASHQVVFESSALYRDVWTNDPMIYGVLFEHALRGFPHAVNGERIERTEVQPARQ